MKAVNVFLVLLFLMFSVNLFILDIMTTYTIGLVFVSCLIVTYIVSLWDYKKPLKRGEKINIILAISIVFLTLTQTLISIFTVFPRPIGQPFNCPSELSFGFPEKIVEVPIQLGNYGQIPAYVYYNITSTSGNLSVVSNAVYMILPSISFYNNQQSIFPMKLHLGNYSEKLSFKPQRLVYGDDLLTRAMGLWRFNLKIFDETNCTYIDKETDVFRKGQVTPFVYKLVT